MGHVYLIYLDIRHLLFLFDDMITDQVELVANIMLIPNKVFGSKHPGSFVRIKEIFDIIIIKRSCTKN